jgi:hypothetical protein
MKGDENPGPSEDKHEELEKYHGKLILLAKYYL